MKRMLSVVAVWLFIASLVFANVALADFSGTVTFRNDKASSDKFTVSLTGLPAAPSGQIYIGWLVSDDGKTMVNTGAVTIGADGTATASYTSPKGDNLIGLYNKYLVTSEANADAQATAPKGTVVAEADGAPTQSLMHVRHVIYQWDAAPNKTGFAVGVLSQATLLSQHAHFLQDALTSGNLATAKQHAEHIVNIVEGSTGKDFGDLNKDGKTENPGDGFGLLVYATNAAQHATFAASTPDASAYVKLHATHVSDTSQNVIDWATIARDDALKVLSAADVAAATPLAADLVKNADLALNGVSTQPVRGQGGAKTVYEHAQNMGGFNFLTQAQLQAAATKPAAATAAVTTTVPVTTTAAVTTTTAVTSTAAVTRTATTPPPAATALPKSGDRLPLEPIALAGIAAIALGLGLRRLTLVREKK